MLTLNYLKQAKENPDLLTQKNVELIMKYDVKTLEKNTKVLPPMLNANQLQVKSKLNRDELSASAIL